MSGELEDRLQRVVGARGALGVGPPAVGLDEHAEAIARGRVHLGEPRRRLADREAGARILVLDERRVEVDRQVAQRGQPGDDGRRDRGRRAIETVGPVRDRREVDADVVLELRAIGRVEIDEQHRIAGREHAEHRAGLRRVGLHEVAVEVLAGRVGAEAHLLWAALVGPVVRRESLVTVRVHDRHEHDRDAIERSRRELAVEEIAEHREAGVLALDLTCVDAALDVDHRQVRRAVDRHGDDRAVLDRAADLDAADTGVRSREVVAQRDRLGVAPGAGVVRALGRGGQGRMRPGRAGARGEPDDGERTHASRYHSALPCEACACSCSSF